MRTILMTTLLILTLQAHATDGDAYRQAIDAIDACDYPRALAPLRSAAAAGDRRAQALLGLMLIHGPALYAGIATEPVEAITWLRRAAQQGDAVSAWAVRRIPSLAGGTATRHEVLEPSMRSAKR